MKKNIIIIANMVFGAFLLVILYQTYIQVYQGSSLLNHPRNRRLLLLEETVQRGRIVDSGGRVLAESFSQAGLKKRVYPYGELTSNLTGYLSRRYGRAGLEMVYNKELVGLTGSLGADFWALQRINTGHRGNDIILSLDVELQQAAWRLLGPRKGAVVALEPATGRVLAMVSKPGYNPQRLETDWPALNTNQDSPLLNRATQGLYPPGSTMKVITAAGILEKNPSVLNRVFDAPGYIVIEGRRIEDKQAVGRLTLVQAMAKSSNFVFATLGLEQGAQALLDTAHRFGLDRRIPFDLPANIGLLPQPAGLSRLELGETAIGQGRVMVTPMSMALVAAGVANGGRVMAPQLVDKVKDQDGGLVQSSQPRLLWETVNGETAGILRELMTAAVSRGTGAAANLQGVKVAGKTGSAENPHGQPHAWFIGFAPAEKPQVAVAVIVENGGAGGREAAPIAGEIIRMVIAQKR